MKHFYLTLCLLLLSLGAWAGITPATGTTHKAAAEPTMPALEKPLPAARPLAPEGWEALALQQMEALVAAQPLELQQRRFEEFSVAAPLAVDVMVEGPMYSSGTPLDSVQFYIAKARAVIDKIRSTGNFIKNFDAKTQVELPVGISKTIGGLEYTVGIDSIRLLPTHAEFDAYMEFTPKLRLLSETQVNMTLGLVLGAEVVVNIAKGKIASAEGAVEVGITGKAISKISDDYQKLVGNLEVNYGRFEMPYKIKVWDVTVVNDIYKFSEGGKWESSELTFFDLSGINE